MDFTNRIRGFVTIRVRRSKPDALPATALEEKQQLLAHMVRLVAQGASFGLFVAGQGGLGKSRTIQATLASEGISPVLVNSHVTPLALYRTLFAHRKGEVIWLDDCDSIYANLQVLGLLRSALWGQGERIVTYLSSQLDDLPSQFSFESRIVFCANTIPARNEAFKAVLSRVDMFSLDATSEEVLEHMRYLATRGHHRLSPEQCREVVDFIDQARGSRQLSLRLYEPSLAKVEYAREAGIDWRMLVKCQLDQLSRGRHQGPSPVESKELDFTVLAQAIEAHPESVLLQEAYWIAVRQKSRASFFRCKKAYEEQQKAASDPPADDQPPKEQQ